jgi:hypothetical protein
MGYGLAELDGSQIYGYKHTYIQGNRKVETFFSFWISDTTPAIPTNDLELVRWTLKTLQWEQSVSATCKSRLSSHNKKLVTLLWKVLNSLKKSTLFDLYKQHLKVPYQVKGINMHNFFKEIFDELT